MSLRRKDVEFVASPGERLVVLQDGINRDVLTYGKKSVAVVVVVKRSPLLPKQLGLVKQVPLVFRDRELRSVLILRPSIILSRYADNRGSILPLRGLIVKTTDPLNYEFISAGASDCFPGPMTY